MNGDTKNGDIAPISPFARLIYLLVGWIFVALGAIGAFLPILPTVPFLLVAAWAFSKSSKRLHDWLYSHRIYGPYLVAWSRYGVIPLSAKIMAVGAMAVGWTYYTFWIAQNWWIPAIVGLTELGVAAYIVTRPSRPPSQRPDTADAQTMEQPAEATSAKQKEGMV